jgi:hypothetical protein
VPKTIPIKNSTACRLVRCDPIKPKGQAMAKVSTSTGALWKSIEIYADGLAEIDQYGPNSQLVFYGLMNKRAAL